MAEFEDSISSEDKEPAYNFSSRTLGTKQSSWPGYGTCTFSIFSDEREFAFADFSVNALQPKIDRSDMLRKVIRPFSEWSQGVPCLIDFLIMCALF